MSVRLYFVVLVCLCFSWGQHDSVSALNIVDSSVSVFIPVLPCPFEQFLPNLSSFDQFIVSSNLKNLAKPRTLEKHSGSFVWKLIFEPGCVLVSFFWIKNEQYVYTHIDVIIYPDSKLLNKITSPSQVNIHKSWFEICYKKNIYWRSGYEKMMKIKERNFENESVVLFISLEREPWYIKEQR